MEYTRIIGELKKLGIKPPSRNTVKKILKTAGFEPGPKRGEGTGDKFLKQHAASLWQCDCAPCKGGSFQRVRAPPGNWCFQPEAIGAAVSATKPLKPLVKRVA
jgi:hypothetical protein